MLEIGCGIGTDSVNFARNGANLSVVELSEASLELCKQRFNIYDLDAEFYRGNSENLNDLLPAGKKFDLIYSFGVIHHTEFPERIIEQIKSRLKPSVEVFFKPGDYIVNRVFHYFSLNVALTRVCQPISSLISAKDSSVIFLKLSVIT